MTTRPPRLALRRPSRARPCCPAWATASPWSPCPGWSSSSPATRRRPAWWPGSPRCPMLLSQPVLRNAGRPFGRRRTSVVSRPAVRRVGRRHPRRRRHRRPDLRLGAGPGGSRLGVRPGRRDRPRVDAARRRLGGRPPAAAGQRHPRSGLGTGLPHRARHRRPAHRRRRRGRRAVADVSRLPRLVGAARPGPRARRRTAACRGPPNDVGRDAGRAPVRLARPGAPLGHDAVDRRSSRSPIRCSASCCPTCSSSSTSPERLGVLLMAFSLGSIVGALAYSGIGHRVHQRAAFVVGMAGNALAPGLPRVVRRRSSGSWPAPSWGG